VVVCGEEVGNGEGGGAGTDKEGLNGSWLPGKIEVGKEQLSFVDKVGSLNRLQMHEVLSVQMTPEDHHLMDLCCLSILNFQSLSPQSPQSNQPVPSSVTLHGMAAKTYHRLSFESQNQCLNDFPDGTVFYPWPIHGLFLQGLLADCPSYQGIAYHHSVCVSLIMISGKCYVYLAVLGCPASQCDMNYFQNPQ